MTENDVIYPVYWDKIFDKVCLYDIALKFHFFASFGMNKKFWVVEFGKILMGRSGNAKQRYFFIWPKLRCNRKTRSCTWACPAWVDFDGKYCETYSQKYTN